MLQAFHSKATGIYVEEYGTYICLYAGLLLKKQDQAKSWLKYLSPYLVFWCSCPLIYFKCVKKRTSRIQLSLPDEKFPRVSYEALVQATDNFAEFNLIGRGSSGSVYRGRLTQPNKPVAVKVVHHDMQNADRSYMAECKALKNIRHRNLLPILTACSTIDNRGFQSSTL